MKILRKFGVILVFTGALTSLSAHAVPNTMSNFYALKFDKDVFNLKIQKTSGIHWVDPYFRADGTFVMGHLRSNPDGICWNNLNGC